MAANIKGIVVEIGGDTTKLGEALKAVDKKSRDLSSELGQINKQLKLDPKNTDLLAQKQTVLAEAVTNTSEKLDRLKRAEKQVQAQFERGEVSEEQVRALKREIISTEKKLGQYENAAKETAEAVEKLGDGSSDAQDDIQKTGKESKTAAKNVDDFSKSADKADKSSGGLGKTLGSVAKAGFAAVAAAATAAIGGLVAAAESTREYRTEMGKLETAFTSNGHTLSAATETYRALQGVLGDTDQAVEAANHLAKLTDNEQDLATWSGDILPGVFATFGASLPIEGLTEAANETAKVGQVTGPLADALNWAGVSEDAFNKSLEKCSTEQERQALITETLAGLYGEASAAYKETNAEVIRANQANEEWTSSLAELGGAIEPIITDVKMLGASLLSDLAPGVQQIAESFRGLLSGDVGAAESIGTALSGIITQLLTKVTEMLPTIAQAAMSLLTSLTTTIIGMLPQLITTGVQIIMALITGLTQAIPQIVQAIVNMIPQLANALVTGIPQLIQGAVQLLLAIVQAIPQIIPPLIAALPQIIMSIINGLLGAIPQLIQGALQFLLAIVDAIPLLVETLIPMIPQIVTTIIMGLLDAIPQLLDAAVTLLLSIVKAIPQICVALIKALPQIWQTMFNYFKQLPGKLWEILKSLVQNFVRWATESRQAAMDGAKNILSAIVNTIKDLPGKIWSWLLSTIDKIVQFGANAVNKAKSAAKNILNAVVNGIKSLPEKVKTIGSDLVKGLWNGIKNMAGWVKEKISGFTSDVLDGIKSFFGINSPSTVMRDEVGKNIVTGLSVGIIRNEKIAMKSAKRMAEDVVDAANDGIAQSADAAEDLAKKVLDAAKKRFDVYETYNDVTLADEVAFWDKVCKEIQAGTDARLEADKKYLTAKKSFDEALLAAQNEYQSEKAALDQKLVEAEETYQKAIDSTREKIEQRTESILTSMGLFDAFEAKEASSHDILLNMASQVSALKEWDRELLELKAKLGETDLYYEIEAQGVDALGQLQAINAMTYDELMAYQRMYEQRETLARGQAERELKGENEQTIAEAYQEYIRQSNEIAQESATAYQTYIDKCAELGVTVSTVESEITSATETALTALTDSTAAANKAMVDSAQTSLSALTDVALKLQSLQTLMGLTGLGPLNVGASSGSSSSGTGVSALLSKLDGIYERLGRLQVYLDGHTLVGGIIDDIDAALGNKQLLNARGV